MPALPSISEWLPSGAVIGFGLFLFGVVRSDLKAMETRLREDLKASEERQQEALKASEARQQEALKAMEARQREELREMRAEQRADNKALNEKLDRFVESMMAAKAS